MRPGNKVKILILDDDTTYCKVIAREATRQKVETIVCHNVSDFLLAALDGEYDIAIIDYNLDTLQGDIVAKAIEDKPVLIMSHDDVGVRSHWPETVQGFIPKTTPVHQVIAKTLQSTKLKYNRIR